MSDRKLSNLVLTRSLHESVRIGDDVEITVVQLSPQRVRLSIRAPRDIKVFRTELLPPAAAEEPTAAPVNVR